MVSSVRTVTKALAAEEDLLLGEGVAQQTRAGKSYTVTKVSGFRPVNSDEELLALNPIRFPKAALVKNNTVQFMKHNGAEYEALVLVTKTLVVTSNTSTIAPSADTVIFNISTAHEVSDILSGLLGQKLTIVSTTINTTIKNSTSVVLKGGADYLIPVNTGLQLVYTGSVWAEV